MVIGIILIVMEVKNYFEVDRIKQVFVIILKLYIILFVFIFICDNYYLLILLNKKIFEICRLMNMFI